MSRNGAKPSEYPVRLRLLLSRLPRYSYLPLWYLYRILHGKDTDSRPLRSEKQDTDSVLATKERFLQEILAQARGKAFLEIGIGEFPNLRRVQAMADHRILYTACDFRSVCDIHKKELELRKIDTTRIRFAPNAVGTYSWTLLEMLLRQESFDIIYLDGHHTFYVDLPAIVLSHFLLKPGGYILVDDILWTLDFLKGVMLRSFDAWYFYRRMYNFSEYEPEQRSIPHMKFMAEALLMDRLGYSKIDRYSLPEWWTLRKPL